MGILEPITHSEEIKELLESAENTYNSSKSEFETQKESTTKSLERLGKVKVKAWANEMDAFTKDFSAFNNIDVVQKIDTNFKFVGMDEEPQQMVINMQQASLVATEITKAGVAALGTGALVGIASYGGAMMFGSASTGTAISSLKGIAKKNATLAWFGGGALSAGGIGMAGGALVLAGVVAAPVLAVAAVITAKKADEKLAEARSINAEAMNAAAQIDKMTTGMASIARMSNNYSSFIGKLSDKFKPFVKELTRIRNKYNAGPDGTIDFNQLTEVEQKTLHLAWLLAQIYYHALSTPILNDQGEVSEEASHVLTTSQKEFDKFIDDTFKMRGAEGVAANVLWGSYAEDMTVISIGVVAALAILAFFTFKYSVILGLLDLIGVAIVFPINAIQKNTPATKIGSDLKLKMIIGIIFVFACNVFFLTR